MLQLQYMDMSAAASLGTISEIDHLRNIFRQGIAVNTTDTSELILILWDTLEVSILSDNPSMVSCFSNLMYSALDTKFGSKILAPPKLVVVFPDDDIIKLIMDKQSFDEDTQDISHSFGCILNHIMVEHERTVSAYKEYLPAKAIRSTCPQILWIQAPFHDGFVQQ